MSNILDASVQFPTVIFTIGLGIALVYWVFVLLGALDIDVFGHGHGGDGGAGAHDVDHDSVGIASVPLTISLSTVLLVAWTLSILGMHYVGNALLVLLLALVGGVALALLLVRPLAPFFRVKTGKSNQDYVGATCTVSTGHVDDGFGQATVEDGGTVLVIAVRCDRANTLGRGRRALIIEFDPGRQVYVVEPIEEESSCPSS